MKRTSFFAAALAWAALPCFAEDLLQVYRDAQRYDAQYSGARYALEAGREKLPQGRALVLPTLGLTGNLTRQRVDSVTHDPAVAASFLRYPRAFGYQLTFTQPVFRLQNWLQYDQAEYQVRQAEATFGLAAQDLLLRVAQAYFDLLAAQDTLDVVRTQ